MTADCCVMDKETVDSNKKPVGEGKARRAKDYYKWLTLAVAIASIFAEFYRSEIQLRYETGGPASQSPIADSLIHTSVILINIAFFSSLILGVATLPRWQGFFALAVVVFIMVHGIGV
jgi:divalent metal cation (Fe/Co/Zn/Cd) transporter